MALGFDLTHAALYLFDVSPHDQLITGDDGMAEADLIDARKEGDETAVFFRVQEGDAANLGHGFGNEDARHNRFARKVALKKLLIKGRILDADGIFHRFQFNDPVNKHMG
mgnify:FL=1